MQERLELIASTPFARMSYTEAVEVGGCGRLSLSVFSSVGLFCSWSSAQVLQKHIEKKDVKFEFEVEWGKELQTEHE